MIASSLARLLRCFRRGVLAGGVLRCLRLGGLAGLLVVVSLFGGCGQNDVRVSSANAQSGIAPKEVAHALADLADHILTQTAILGDRIDNLPGTDDRIRRATLTWRLRTAEATSRAKSRSNSVVGLCDLWFFTLSMEAYYTRLGAAGPEGSAFASATATASATASATVTASATRASAADYNQTIVEAVRGFRADAEKIVARVVPKDRFPALRDQMTAAAGSGQLLLTSGAEQEDLLNKVLDTTHLESLISIALSPFDALEGIGTGGDAMAQLVVTANRAVSLAQDYPQLLSWQLRLALVDVDDDDTMTALRAEIHHLGVVADDLPTRMRVETVAMLDGSGKAQADLRSTLGGLAAAAATLNQAALSIDAAVRDIQTLAGTSATASATATGPAGAPGRPFDIREYTAAFQAAAEAARSARDAIATANAPASHALLDDAVRHSQALMDEAVKRSQALVDDTVARSQAAVDRTLFWTYALLLGAAVAGAGLIILHHAMRHHYAQKTQGRDGRPPA